jgi:uncharacterized protein (TIGR00369 family)
LLDRDFRRPTGIRLGANRSGDDPMRDGFLPHTRSSPVTAPWEPIFARIAPGSYALGLVIRQAHCNGRGFLHGGVIAALADNAMGLTFVSARTDGLSAVTLSLTTDYVGSARPDQWLEITPRLIKAGASIGFVDALVTADDAVIARANAVFKAV